MPVDQLHGSPLSKSLPALFLDSLPERAEHRKRHVTFSTAYPRVPQGALIVWREGSEGAGGEPKPRPLEPGVLPALASVVGRLFH